MTLNASTTPSLRMPPHSLEAEQSVIGALFLDNRAWDRIADHIVSMDFYRKEHTLIFNAIEELAEHQQPFDVLTVAEKLKAKNNLNQVGGESYLFELANNTPSAANVLAYANIVRERSILRQLIHIGSDIVDSGFNQTDTDVKTLLDKAEQLIFNIAEQQARGAGPVKINTLTTQAYNHINQLAKSTSPITGLPTGFGDLDGKTSGLQKGDLIVIAGRPSMGKTSFAMNIAEHIAIDAKKTVLIFSMEMPSEQLTLRMLSSLGRVDQHKVRTGRLSGQDWKNITSAVNMLLEAPIYIDDTPALTPTELRARARRIAREHHGLSLIVIDYLQLMQVANFRENRAMEISAISRALKALAKELNVPVIALSQLNRSLEHRTDRRPVMSDLRESGSIEQDADVIAFIYRDEVYNKDTADKGLAEILIRKQRNGPIGDFPLTFLGQYTRFENFSTQSIPDEVLV